LTPTAELIGYKGCPFRHTSILRIGNNWSIVSLRLDGNNLCWADFPWNGWRSIKTSIFESTRNHLPTIIMVHCGWVPWSSGSGIIAMRCGSPGIKTNMDMTQNPKELPYLTK
jgi:hypothetical protein